MYRGFNITDVLFIHDTNENFARKYTDSYDKYRKEISSTLNRYVLSDNILDGSKMQADWFPQINADIFISHSHEDEEYAKSLAGKIQAYTGLSCFIDSCVWNYADDLLRKVDDNYCQCDDSHTYDYQKRNYSTSHIHMMLNAALMKMIDKCECLFFLNTPNSIKTENIFESTYSPWIFSEISISKYIRKKIPERKNLKRIRDSLNKSFSMENFEVQYQLDLAHLTDICEDDLNKWLELYLNDNKYSLDTLYNLYPING
ncbi:MAG: toll/interleukin-1 receptor domain-containing protein [Treponema sp.]|nr:toll/interleukin-1 receptor domain-containing protein [Treponema sp.]